MYSQLRISAEEAVLPIRAVVKMKIKKKNF
jgi:hypothetical protein